MQLHALVKVDADAFTLLRCRMTEHVTDVTITAWARVIRVPQRLLKQVEADLKAAGCPPLAWYDALLELKRAGNAGLRPFQLQKEMLLEQYNLSRLLDRIVKSGLAERLATEADGRGQILKITADGRSLLRRMWPIYRAAIQKHFAERLDTRELAELGRILGKLRSP
jgi:DNA-binding MarR family transcriptional regulator